MSISDYPERISISPTYRQKREDDFYLVDRKAFPGKGTEYVRADRIEELEAKLAKAVARIDKLIYWLDIDDELWDALTAMEKSDHRRAQSEAQAIKSILTGGKDE